MLPSTPDTRPKVSWGSDPYQGYFYPFTFTERKVSGGATNEELAVGPVPPGRMWIVEWAAVEDETTGYTYLRLVIGRLGEDHFIGEQRSPLAARLYWPEHVIRVPEGRTLIARLNGTTSADRLAFYVDGFEVRQPETSHA